MQERIINESNNILYQFNKTNLDKMNSFFSYSYMFRYIFKSNQIFISHKCRTSHAYNMLI